MSPGGAGGPRTVLAAGFGREALERLSAVLRDAGFHVLGASGRSSTRTLAGAASPDVVLVPSGEAGAEALGWLDELAVGVAVRSVDAEGPVEAVLAAMEVARDEAEPASGRPDQPETPRGALPEATSPAVPAVAPACSPPADATAPAAHPVPGRSGTVGAAGTLAERLEAKLVQVRFGDYHVILEVQPGATAYVIREQHQRLSALYSPTGWPARVGAEDIPVLDEIARGIEDAFTVLGDADLRARYERALHHGRALAPRRS